MITPNRVENLTILLVVVLASGFVMASSFGSEVGTAGKRLYESQTRVAVNVTDPRPLAAAVRQLEDQLGIVITYEDPRFAYKLDIQDVTSTVARAPVPSGKRILIPRGGSFVFNYNLPHDMTLLANRAAVISAMIQAYEVSWSAATFSVIENNGLFHVLPVSANDEAGKAVPQNSILDALISVPDGERDADSMIEAVRDATLRATGVRFGIMSTPTNILRSVRIRGPVKAETARTVLSRTLVASGKKLSWQMLYDPGLKTYGFSIHTVTG